MEKVRPVFINVLIVAVVIFVAGVSLALSDLFNRVGKLEHDSMHATAATCSSRASHR